MADNIGSAILAGIQGVQQNARQRQAMLLQEQELDLARQRSAREDEQLKIQQEQLGINKDVNARAQQQQTELLRTNAKTRLTEDPTACLAERRALASSSAMAASTVRLWQKVLRAVTVSTSALLQTS